MCHLGGKFCCYNSVTKVESSKLVGWCSMESSAACPIYCKRWKGPASFSIAKMGSSTFPLCLALLFSYVYGTPVSVSRNLISTGSSQSRETSHTLYWLYFILFQVWHLSGEAGKCSVCCFEFWSIFFCLLCATTCEHNVLSVLQQQKMMLVR